MMVKLMDVSCVWRRSAHSDRPMMSVYRGTRGERMNHCLAGLVISGFHGTVGKWMIQCLVSGGMTAKVHRVFVILASEATFLLGDGVVTGMERWVRDSGCVAHSGVK